MLLVNMPTIYFESKINNDNEIDLSGITLLKGLITEQNNAITFSPILDTTRLTYDLIDSDSYITLTSLEMDQPNSVILLEKSIALSEEEFETQVMGQALVRPTEYERIKNKYSEFEKGITSYINDYQMNSNNSKFSHSSLRYFNDQYPTNSNNRLENRATNNRNSNYRQPFLDVNSQKEYDKISKNFDPTRIAKSDIKQYGKEKKDKGHGMTLGL